MLTVLMISGLKCVACKRMVPVFERVANEYREDRDVKFQEEDVQSIIPFLQEHQIEITTLPSFVIMIDERVANILYGVHDFDQLCDAVDDALDM